MKDFLHCIIIAQLQWRLSYQEKFIYRSALYTLLGLVFCILLAGTYALQSNFTSIQSNHNTVNTQKTDPLTNQAPPPLITVPITNLLFSQSNISSSSNRTQITVTSTTQTNTQPVKLPDTNRLLYPVGDLRNKPGYREMLALKKAYPDKISVIQYRRKDWALLVRDTWFYWKGGRLLQKKHFTEYKKFDPYTFYTYKTGPMGSRSISPEMLVQIRDVEAKEKIRPDSRLPNFYNTLWKSYGKKSSWNAVTKMKLFGHKFSIHKELVPTLNRIEKEINALAKKDRQVAHFISRIKVIGGWHYRVILGTRTRSLHSYGLALDFEPSNLKQHQVYWRWTRMENPEWYKLDYKDMWIPPDAFIQVFEKYGFVWGGKWLFFDTIHFEYRPEILIYNGYKPLPLLRSKK